MISIGVNDVCAQKVAVHPERDAGIMETIQQTMANMVTQTVQAVLAQFGIGSGIPIPVRTPLATQDSVTLQHIPPPREDESITKKSKSIDPKNQDLNHHKKT